MNGTSFRSLPLGFPRGEAGFFGKRHFGTDWQKILMRGGDRLVYECGWMNGVCFSFLPFNRDFLDFLAFATPHQSRQNIGSEVPIFHRDSFPPGEAKNSETIRYYHSTKRSIAGVAGRQFGAPYRASAFI